MSVEHIAALSDLLANTDIGLLELRGPSGRLRLTNTPAGIVALEDDAVSSASYIQREPSALVLSASSPGVFLRNHPLRESPLVQAGGAVRAGEVVGLLQIGLMLRPVVSPKAGRLAGALVPHGAVVGYGTPLMELHIETDES